MKLAFFAVRMWTFWAVVASLFVGCSDDDNTDTGEKKDPVPVLEELVLDKESVTLDVGDQYTFEVKLLPEDVQDVVLTWTSSDPEVVSVEEGTVTALAYGEATVEVRSGDIAASCQVIVDDGVVDVESVTLNATELELILGENYQLEATVEPADAEYTLTWKSSNIDVIKVDTKGLVMTQELGEATVTVTAGGVTAECAVVVKEVPVESVTLNVTELEFEVGEHFALMATVLPENATNKGVTWTSLDETVATVDMTGLVQAVGAGSTTIKATAGAYTAECMVVVTAPETPPASPSSVNVGDYFYSDGTWSTELQNDKTVIGVVFYAGDATASDAALARDHSGCTHGLAVSIAEVATTWQSNYEASGKTVSSWIEANLTDYEPILTSGTAANAGKLMGYNNTKAIEAYNAASENSAWPVEAVQSLESFRAGHAAPSSTSGWYMPSVREMSLLVSGDAEGNFEEESSAENLAVVNGVLENISGASKIQGVLSFLPGYYQTSSEADVANIFQVSTANAQATYSTKREALKLRPILAF